MPIWLPLKSDPLVFDDALLLEFGRVLILWAKLEHALLSDIQQLIEIGERNGVTFAFKTKIQNAFSGRLDLWIKLSEDIYANIPNMLTNAKEIYNGLKIISKTRNVLIHGLLDGGKPLDDGSVRLATIQPADQGKVMLAEYKINTHFLKIFGSDVTQFFDHIISMQVNRLLGTHRA